MYSNNSISFLCCEYKQGRTRLTFSQFSFTSGPDCDPRMLKRRQCMTSTWPSRFIIRRSIMISCSSYDDWSMPSTRSGGGGFSIFVGSICWVLAVVFSSPVFSQISSRRYRRGSAGCLRNCRFLSLALFCMLVVFSSSPSLPLPLVLLSLLLLLLPSMSLLLSPPVFPLAVFWAAFLIGTSVWWRYFFSSGLYIFTAALVLVVTWISTLRMDSM